jgi:hypothetical protein
VASPFHLGGFLASSGGWAWVSTESDLLLSACRAGESDTEFEERLCPRANEGEGESGSRMGDGKESDPAWFTKLPVTGAVSGGPVASPDPGLASWPEGQAGAPRRLA